jgi:hypothetical protein
VQNPASNYDPQFVGWSALDPTITFTFSQTFTVNTIAFYFDGSQVGGVFAPQSVTVTSVVYPVTAPPAGTVFQFDVQNIAITTSSLTLSIQRLNAA